MNLDATRTWGFDSITRPNDGTYCLKLAADSTIDPTELTAVASVEREHTPGSLGTYFFAEVWVNGALICPGGADFAVLTRVLPAGTTVPNPQASNDVAFTVAIP